MDNKLTETGSSNRRVAAVPIWIKPYLTIEEAAEYTGIGRDKLYEMTSLADCPFVLWVGNRRMIKRRIFDEYIEQILKNENPEVLLPHFSCHSLRHTFTTRMCEAGVNVKVIQDTLGHKDISTTLNIYTDVTKELRQSEFEGLDSYFKSEYNKVSNE